jgi:hypothetical protein
LMLKDSDYRAGDYGQKVKVVAEYLIQYPEFCVFLREDHRASNLILVSFNLPI